MFGVEQGCTIGPIFLPEPLRKFVLFDPSNFVASVHALRTLEPRLTSRHRSTTASLDACDARGCGVGY
jgi:hypothetical protein